jgi:hypothetical protein
MIRRKLFTTLVAVAELGVPTAVLAALVVNPPRPVAYRVSVQIIQTALDDGSSPATVLGDASQTADIESRIDSIWAQAGIDINFLPNVVRYNNSFAYQGDAIGGVRPLADLSQTFSMATTDGGILNSDPSIIDMMFVSVVPGWPAEAANWVCGTSNVGTNGIAEFIGSNIPTTESGKDWAAHWISHEIGHNLGLYHSIPGTANLMNATKRVSEQLTSDQIDAVVQSNYRFDDVAYVPKGGTGFSSLILQPVPGDYNRDGAVNAADYTVWRDTLGSTAFMAADGDNNGTIDVADYATWQSHFGAHIQVPLLPGDFNHSGSVDAADYTVWRDSLGASVAFGSGADANLNGLIDAGDYTLWQANFGTTLEGAASATTGDVPEPTAILLATIAVAPFATRRYRQVPKQNRSGDALRRPAADERLCFACLAARPATEGDRCQMPAECDR